MPCQVFFRDRYVNLSHGCLEYVIESADEFCRVVPHPDYIRTCIVRWQELAASSGNNLLDLDLDRLAASPERAAELQHFLADLRQWVDEYSRGTYPDGRAATWVDEILTLFAKSTEDNEPPA
jgi:hypothetical protein